MKSSIKILFIDDEFHLKSWLEIKKHLSQYFSMEGVFTFALAKQKNLAEYNLVLMDSRIGNVNALDFVESDLQNQIDSIVFTGYDGYDDTELPEEKCRALHQKYAKFRGVLPKHNYAREYFNQIKEMIVDIVEGRIDYYEPFDARKIISTLKHRIDHLFLPTVIDLQGIDEELADEEKQPDEKERIKTAREYLKDVFDMRRDEQAYYCNRLNRARYLTVGHQDADTEKAFRLIGLEDVEEQALKTWIASGQPEAQLPEKKSMRDLVQKALESQWERFIKLLGLCQVDDNTFKCNSASPIQQFMHQMDSWLKEYPKLPKLNEVLDFFKQSHDWGLKDITIHSFGDWFSELADAMDKLRESLPTN